MALQPSLAREVSRDRCIPGNIFTTAISGLKLFCRVKIPFLSGIMESLNFMPKELISDTLGALMLSKASKFTDRTLEARQPKITLRLKATKTPFLPVCAI